VSTYVIERFRINQFEAQRPLWIPFSGVLAYLINLSETSSIVAKQWKVAIIHPVAKVPQPVTPSDFSPISFTPIISRLTERERDRERQTDRERQRERESERSSGDTCIQLSKIRRQTTYWKTSTSMTLDQLALLHQHWSASSSRLPRCLRTMSSLRYNCSTRYIKCLRCSTTRYSSKEISSHLYSWRNSQLGC